MKYPIAALHTSHNASLAIYYKGKIKVVEFERYLNAKDASYDTFEPRHSHIHSLQNIYNYLKKEYGFIKYSKLIIGEHGEVKELYKESIPADEYVIDYCHHQAHAYGSLTQSPFKKSLIISFDGGGVDGRFNIYVGEKGKDLELINSFDIDLGSHYHLIGSFCSEVKNYKQLTAAGKVLGLQSYGEIIDEWINPLRDFFTSKPPYWQDLDSKITKLSERLGIEFSRVDKLEGTNSYNLARTAQHVFETIFFEHVDNIIPLYDLPLILTGGCALNIVLNTKVKDKYGKELFIAPNSSDCGLAVGFLTKHLKLTDSIDITYAGVSVLDEFTLMEQVEHRLGKKADLKQITYDLINNRILGVVQGDAEHGPRALGNRSIICSPISPDMKDILNLKVKHREWFRPFAPIVRLEDVSEYFEWEGESRWMNFCPKVKEEYLYKIPAVVHVDGTARVQTVTREQNPFIYDLLTEFKEKTGIGVLVNTSFNVDGKPILSTYKDAFKVFDETQLDRLYLDEYYFVK